LTGSTAAFWDSSALNPLLVNEPTTPWANAMATRFALAVWWATPVEIHSAIARVRRSGELDDHAHRLALNNLAQIQRDWQEILPSDAIRDQAQAILGLYPLRAADSLQLAAALIWCRNRPTGRNFLCADTRLAEAATTAGFTVLRP
jgi:predicted nucleic acid-binding protein